MVERIDQAAAYRAYGISSGKVKSSLQKKDGADQDPGVYFELSDTVKEAAREKEKPLRPSSVTDLSSNEAPDSSESTVDLTASSPAAKSPSLPDFRKLLDRASVFLKTLGGRIASVVTSFWNGENLSKTQTEASADTEDADQGEILQTGTVIAGEVEYLPKTTDVKAIRDYMKDYGGRHLAVNTDILTSYDRYGRIVQHDPSDADRLLRKGSDQLIDTGKKR